MYAQDYQRQENLRLEIGVCFVYDHFERDKRGAYA